MTHIQPIGAVIAGLLMLTATSACRTGSTETQPAYLALLSLRSPSA